MQGKAGADIRSGARKKTTLRSEGDQERQRSRRASDQATLGAHREGRARIGLAAGYEAALASGRERGAEIGSAARDQAARGHNRKENREGRFAACDQATLKFREPGDQIGPTACHEPPVGGSRLAGGPHVGLAAGYQAACCRHWKDRLKIGLRTCAKTALRRHGKGWLQTTA